MKSKPKSLLLLVFFLCVYRTSHAASYITWSEVESLVVDRSGPAHDVFTVNMKPHHYCTNGTVSQWCNKLSAFVQSLDHDATCCKCICIGSFYSFIPQMQRCIDATMAKSLIGGCQRYFDEQSLLAHPGYPVKLTKSSSKTFSVSNAKSCTISQDYFTHDYSGFESNWKTVNNNGFFGLSMTNNAPSFTITWKADTAGTLSGRIVRLDVTCSKRAGGDLSSSTGCILLKARGTVTYTAPVHRATTSNYLPVASSYLESKVSVSSASSVLSSNTGTSASPELTSSFPTPAQSQTARLPAVTTGQGLHPSSVMVNPIEPAKTTSTARVSSSSAGGDGGYPGDRGTRTSGNNNGVVIGAAVGGALVLGIIVIIIVFWKRRKAGKTTEKQTKQVKNTVYGTSENDIQLESPNNSASQTMLSSGQDNQPTYQGLIIANGRSNGTAIYSSPEDEYDNCTVYQSLEKPKPGTPVYQSLKVGQAEPDHTTGLPNLKPKPRYTTLPNATGPPIAKGKTATEVPKPNPGAEGQPSQRSSLTPEPVYNVLDGSGSEQGTTPEPLYNVLEGPDRGQDYEARNVDPLYNVLEGPNTTYDSAEIVLESNGTQNGPISGQSPDGDPLYNVHGRSTAHEPLYNVLEGLDAEKSPLVDQGGPINEPLYNVLEGPDSGGSNQHAPNKPCPLSGHDNLAYEQTLEMDVPNAAVQRPWTQRESVYEALRGPTQDVYEALGQSSDPHSTC